MSNIDSKEVDTLKTFLEDFLPLVSKVLKDNFDEDNKISFLFSSADNINTYENLRDSNGVCPVPYSVSDTKGEIVIAIPEDFIATTSDIMMGGDGENAYKGSLGELEVNAVTTIINTIFKSVRKTFQTLYEKDLISIDELKVYTKETQEYNDFFDKPKFNFRVICNLTLGSQSSYPITFLFNSSETKALLTNLALLENKVKKSSPSVMSNNLDKLADIKNLHDVKINLDAELGRSKINIKEVLSFVKGSIIELDAEKNEDLRIFANGLEVARAKPVVVDEHLGIQITKIISPEERYKNL